MRRVIFVLIAVLLLNTMIYADGEGFTKAEVKEVKVYYNLAHKNVLSYEGQLEFLDKTAKDIMPVNKWDVPRAVVTHKLYKDTDTTEITFTASTMKVEASVDDVKLAELAEEILNGWCDKIKTIAEAKAKIAQKNLEKALEYQKKQKATKRISDELNLKLVHEQKKLLAIGDEIDEQNAKIEETKKTIKDLRAKIKEAGEAQQLRRFLEEGELALEEQLLKLENIKEKETTCNDRIKKFNLEIENLPLYNPLTDAYLSELAEKAMILNWKPERIENLGDDYKLK